MWTEQLSVVGDDTTQEVSQRPTSRCLRPIFINGVEVGYAHVQAENPGKRLSVRGITIALWYFICRGHQAQALLPFCFKTYPNKSDGWQELMALYRMNLIEFTPGCGSDKYVEVNRIVALRAREYGGCMVARSQMHSIIEDHPFLETLVEKRLLMPSFNGNDLIFPLDGPLGRIGPSLSATLECSMNDAEWDRCTTQQMKLRDQLFWLNALSLLVPTMVSWSGMVSKIRDVQPRNAGNEQLSFKQMAHVTPFELHPPETNPVSNRGFSVFKRHRWLHEPLDNNNNGLSSNGEFVAEPHSRSEARYRNPQRFPYGVYGGESFRQQKNFRDHMNGSNTLRRVIRTDSEYEERSMAAGGTASARDDDAPQSSRRADHSQNFTRLATIFGYNKAKAVCDKNPNLNNLFALAELALEEDDSEQQQPQSQQQQSQQQQQQQQQEQQRDEQHQQQSSSQLGEGRGRASPPRDPSLRGDDELRRVAKAHTACVSMAAGVDTAPLPSGNSMNSNGFRKQLLKPSRPSASPFGDDVDADGACQRHPNGLLAATASACVSSRDLHGDSDTQMASDESIDLIQL